MKVSQSGQKCDFANKCCEANETERHSTSTVNLQFQKEKSKCAFESNDVNVLELHCPAALSRPWYFTSACLCVCIQRPPASSVSETWMKKKKKPRLLLNPPPPRDATTGRGLTVAAALPSLPPAHVLGAECNKDQGFSTWALYCHGNATNRLQTWDQRRRLSI